MNFRNKIGNTLISDHPNAEIVFKILFDTKEEIYDNFNRAEYRFEDLKLTKKTKIELFVVLMTDKVIDQELIQHYQPYVFEHWNYKGNY